MFKSCLRQAFSKQQSKSDDRKLLEWKMESATGQKPANSIYLIKTFHLSFNMQMKLWFQLRLDLTLQ